VRLSPDRRGIVFQFKVWGFMPNTSEILNPAFIQIQKGVILKDSVELSSMDGDAIASMSEGVSPWQTYNITLKGFSTATSNGSGVIALSIPCDPSSAGYNFAEYSDLSGIFGEVRILAFEIQVVPLNFLALNAVSTPVIVGFNPFSSAAPANEGAVATLIDSVYWNALRDTTSRGSKFSVKFDPRLDFSLTSSVTVTPYAGCPGSYQLYASGFNDGVASFKVLVTGLYQFRARS